MHQHIIENIKEEWQNRNIWVNEDLLKIYKKDITNFNVRYIYQIVTTVDVNKIIQFLKASKVM
jgi:hypothetical protein